MMNKKYKMFLVMCCLLLFCGVFLLSSNVKAHNNMDNTNQVIPSTDQLIGDIYIPRLFEFTYDEYTVSFVEYFQGGLPDNVDYSYNYNGVNYVGKIPLFTENGTQLFTQYASSFRIIIKLRIIDVANNIDYVVNIAVFLPFLIYANNYPTIYEDLNNIIEYEYIYYSFISTVYPVYALDNDNRSYEFDIPLNLMFAISSDSEFNNDEVEIRIIDLSGLLPIDTQIYVDFYIPNEMLAKDFGNVRYNDGLAQGYNNGFADGASGNDGVFSSIGAFLSTSVGGFLNFELFPNFTLSSVFAILIALMLLVILLKYFMGG